MGFVCKFLSGLFVSCVMPPSMIQWMYPHSFLVLFAHGLMLMAARLFSVSHRPSMAAFAWLIVGAASKVKVANIGNV